MKEIVKVYRVSYVDSPLDEPLIHGTMADVRIFAKELWSEHGMDKDLDMHKFAVEEDYYAFLDESDENVITFLRDYFVYSTDEVCDVPLEDFQE
jgi:hypothetical protein